MLIKIIRNLAKARAAPTNRMNEDRWWRGLWLQWPFQSSPILILCNLWGLAQVPIPPWYSFWSPTRWVFSFFPCNSQYYIFSLFLGMNHFLLCSRERPMSLTQRLNGSPQTLSKSLLWEKMNPEYRPSW